MCSNEFELSLRIVSFMSLKSSHCVLANMNEQDNNGKTPLVLALEAPNSHALVKIIAEHGGA